MKCLNVLAKSVIYSFRLLYKSSKVMFLVYFALDIICATVPLINGFVLKYLLDILVIEAVNIVTVISCIGLYIVSQIILQAFTSAKSVVYNSVFKKAEHTFDCELSEKLAKLPVSIIDTSEGKDMVDGVKYTKVTAVYLSYRVIRIVTLLYSFCVAFGMLFFFNVCFSMLFLVLTIPGVILNVVFEKRVEEFRRKTAPDIRKFCYYRWILTDALSAKDVRMYDLTDSIKGRYNEEKSQYLAANKKLDKKKVQSFLFAEILRRSGEFVFTVYLVIRAIAGEITVGDIALYVGFSMSVSSSFQNMISVIMVGYTWTTKLMERFFDFFAIKTEQSNAIRKLEEFKTLTVDNVYFKYPHTEKYVLTGVSFTLNKGDKLSIVGINGSGKSTIIKLMLGLYEIESGQILINGYPMSDYDIREVRKLFSALFQSFVQYPLTLRENIALSSLEHIDDSDEIESVLRQSGVYEDIKPKLENGLDSFMTRKFDDKGTELSKGQWQKIALSRAYFKNAPIIIFDEPSAALDAEAEDRIFKNFESISDGKTGIMISHRISSARMSNKIIVLDGGKITEQGTHEELVSLNGLYAKLYNLQREKYTIKEGD